MTEHDPRPATGPTSAATTRPYRLGKADAEQLLDAVDHDEVLRPLLLTLLERLVGGGMPVTEEQLVTAAARTAGWTHDRCRLLLGTGSASERERVLLAVELAELRRLG